MGGGAISKPAAVSAKYVDEDAEEGKTTTSTASADDGPRSRQEAEAVAMAFHLMPVFFVPDAVMDDSEFTAVRNSWFLLVEDRCDHYDQLKAKGEMEHPSALVFFFHAFYERLFDVHPSVKPLFRSTVQVQGRKLVSMISMLLSLVDADAYSLHEKLIKLARMHVAIGVLSNQYALMMETLLWTLKHCLGERVFDVRLRAAWLKCLSRVLQVLVPTHILEEMRVKNSGTVIHGH
jgi:hypothetical protein